MLRWSFLQLKQTVRERVVEEEDDDDGFVTTVAVCNNIVPHDDFISKWRGTKE